MAKKKPDLSQMYQIGDSTQKRHNIDIIQAQEKTHEKYAAYRLAEEKETLSASEAKRINMAFSDDTYTWILKESERLGVGAAYYINSIIRQTDPETIRSFYEAQPIKTSKNCVPRRKGKRAQRITIKIDSDVYEDITLGAETYNQTLTQYANLVLEANIKQYTT